MSASAVTSRSELGLGFRSDIEGLRGIAVLLVLLYHAGLTGLSGGYVGVDVFFVLSGYLITRGLVAELQRDGQVQLVTFYARRFRRLLPASTLVLVATVLGARTLASPMVAESVALDGLWSAGWLANQRFIAVGLDYLATDQVESPLLHFWSLAVEEQFYVLWPLLLLLVARTAGTSRRALTIAVGSVTVGSFGWAVIATAANPTVAYLSLPTRAWEMAAGGLLALTTFRPSAKVRTLLAFGGLTVIGWSAISFEASTAFPGPMAALPVLATVAVILAGSTGPSPARRLLDRTLLQRAGRLSYSLYLWHWPLLVLGEHAAGRGLTALERTGMLALSWLLAEVTFRLVENPIRHVRALTIRPRRSVGLGLSLAAGSLAVSLIAAVHAPTLVATGTGDRDLQAAMARLDVPGGAPSARAAADVQSSELPEDGRGGTRTDSVVALDRELAAILAKATTTTEVPAALDPRLEDAGKVIARIYDDGCVTHERESPACVYGDPDGDRTLVLFGDSHAAHYFPPIDALAEQHGWRLVVLAKGGCPSYDIVRVSPNTGRPIKGCPVWRANGIERIADEQPDLIVLANASHYEAYSPTGTPRPGRDAANIADGQRRTVADLATAAPAAEVVVFGPSPRLGFVAPECLAANLQRVDRCTPARQEVVDQELITAQRARAEVDGVAFVDTTRWMCTDDTCPLIVGHLLVYWDTHHLTVSYSRWLQPAIERALFDR
jgi:peptidoglycan/LPS O-acetylase OafA/YrhL